VKPRSAALGRKLPGWLGAALVLGTLAAAIVVESRRPLRQQRQDPVRRNLRNVAMALLTITAIRLTEKPLTDPLTRKVHEKRWGLLPRLDLPPAMELAAATVLLDYTLYLWHVLTHKVPLLWRLHRVHHSDLDLSATTALRFHFVEMILSAPWRAAQVVLVGAAPRALSLWQTLTTMAIMFHHSNIRLPYALERVLVRIFVTPRMHGIHHSIIEHETHSNWGTIFSLPDYLHRTIRLNVPQDRIDIGVPAFRRPEELRLGALIRMPFGAQRPTWRFEGGGEKPKGDEPLPIMEARSEGVCMSQ
jgi:sterol desaturase/sphingolipid hydroxylase (fatty acid hydroxylase superfamily)